MYNPPTFIHINCDVCGKPVITPEEPVPFALTSDDGTLMTGHIDCMRQARNIVVEWCGEAPHA